MEENKKKEFDRTQPESQEMANDTEARPEKVNPDAQPEPEASENSECEKLKADYAALYDKYIRLVAEFDNFKKRTAREKTEIYSAAKIDVVEKLLPVIDNLERAELYSDPEKVTEGLKLIMKQFTEYLEKLDIHEIPAKDAEFDPALHNAVLHEDSDDERQNTVVEVLQKGYTIGDKVIRHAMVKVIN